MKKNLTHYLRKALLLSLLTLITNLTFAQSIWDGGGDGTSWNDALNWNNDMLPTADSIVEFADDVVVTGTAAVGPARITIKGSSNVTLDLNLSIGNGQIDEHAITVLVKSTLNLGAGTSRNFTLIPGSTKQGIAVFNGADSATVNVATNANISILKGTNGINIVNANSTFKNEGSITTGVEVKNGIKTSGDFTNNGSITLANPITDGIVVEAGTFTNGENANIIITKPADDCIELTGGALFTNMGSLNLVAQDSAAFTNNAISVGSATETAEFINMASGEINADGGDKDTGRALSVLDMGSFTNNGLTSISGGDEGSRFYTKGISENGLNAIMDLQDGRINVNAGTFTNNGLIKTTRDGSGIFNSGEAINNAFFLYTNSNSFATGANGVITDNGISLRDDDHRTIDAAGSCDLDIAEAAYEYFEEATSIGTTDGTGGLTLGAEVLTADSVVVTTSIPGVELIIKNVCPAAVMTSSVFNVNEEVNTLRVYPTVVKEGQLLTLDLFELPAENLLFQIFNLNGQLVASEMTYGAEEISISVDDLATGMHFLKIEQGGKTVVGRFLKM